MRDLYIPTDELPFAFFKALDISWESIAGKMIQSYYPDLTDEEYGLILDHHNVVLYNLIYELKDSDTIQDYWLDDEEVDGTMGTWGFSKFEIDDPTLVKINCEKEIESLVRSLLQQQIIEIHLK